MIASTAAQNGFPDAGDLFAERYRILDLVGTGGFSRVYSARQQQLDRRVAVKILAPRGGGSRSSQEIIEKRFYREARLLSRLSGPNTITVYDYGRTSSGHLFMVSELIDGQNLKRLLEAEGPLDEARTRRIFTQILLGLREVHSHGFLHRDIKPSNVMVFDHLGDRDRAKLLDFGIAKGVTVGATDDTALTMTGFVIGTPGYMSPEQALGRPVTRASDLFSAGLIAYEMLTGQSPFRGLSIEQLQRRLMSSPLRMPGTLRLDDDFERVLHRVLAIDADERYETAAGALADLGLDEPDYTVERTETPTTPRPPNLLTFPLQLDSSGSTIVDTIADGESGETTTILLPDTSEEEVPQREVETPPSQTRDRLADGDQSTGNATVVRPVVERRYGMLVWLAGGLVVLSLAGVLAWVLTGDEPGSSEPSPPTAAAGSPGQAIDAAGEILSRSVRNAELDAQIRAKERRLDDAATEPTEFDFAAEPDVGTQPDGSAEQPERTDPEPEFEREPPAQREPRPEPVAEPNRRGDRPDREGGDSEREEKKDFDVTPLDEL